MPLHRISRRVLTLSFFVAVTLAQGLFGLQPIQAAPLDLKLPFAGSNQTWDIINGYDERSHASGDQIYALDIGKQGSDAAAGQVVVAPIGLTVLSLAWGFPCLDQGVGVFAQVDGRPANEFLKICHFATAPYPKHYRQGEPFVTDAEGKNKAVVFAQGTNSHIHLNLFSANLSQFDTSRQPIPFDSEHGYTIEGLSLAPGETHECQKDRTGKVVNGVCGLSSTQPMLGADQANLSNSNPASPPSTWVWTTHTFTTYVPGYQQLTIKDYQWPTQVIMDGHLLLDTTQDCGYVGKLWLWLGKHTYKVGYQSSHPEPSVSRSHTLLGSVLCGSTSPVAVPTLSTQTLSSTGAAASNSTPSEVPSPSPHPVEPAIAYVSPAMFQGSLWTGDLWVAGRDGTDAHEIVAGPVAAPVWSNDGTRLAYIRILATDSPTVQKYQIETVNADGTQKSVVILPRPSTFSVGQYQVFTQVRWGPDDASLYYQFLTGPSRGLEVARHDLADGTETIMPIIASSFDVAQDGTVIFSSPFDETGDQPGWRVALLNVNGQQETVAADADSPTWSPNDRRIALLSGIGSQGGVRLHVMDRTGTALQELAQGWIGTVTWASDGQTLVYDVHDETGSTTIQWSSTIWSVSLNGGLPQQLFTGASPTWRPTIARSSNSSPVATTTTTTTPLPMQTSMSATQSSEPIAFSRPVAVHHRCRRYCNRADSPVPTGRATTSSFPADLAT